MKQRATIIAAVAVVLVFVSMVVLISKNHLTAHQERNRNRLSRSLVYYPPLHTQSVNMDKAYDVVGKRMIQEAKICSHLNIPVAEKDRRVNAVRAAAEAQLQPLQASHWAEPFDVDVFNKDVENRINSK